MIYTLLSPPLVLYMEVVPAISISDEKSNSKSSHYTLHFISTVEAEATEGFIAIQK
jgi:hypothetical protein